MKHFYENKKILITGGAGFIGSHLAEALVNFGARVTILDDLSTGCANNLYSIKNHIHFLKGSVTDIQYCQIAVAHNEIVFHLAALVSVAESMANPDLCTEINVLGTLNMLQACTDFGIKQMVFASSSAVYGSQNGLCYEDSFCKPESPYGHSKRIGELLCKQYFRQYALPTTCLRYFNVYGPRQKEDGPYVGVVAAFKRSMANNEPLTIFGDGLQKRDFIHVKTVVQATLLAGTLHKRHEIYNIATGKSITLLELFEKLKTEFPQYQQKLTFQPARKNDIIDSQADCSRMHALLEQAGLYTS